MINRIIEFSALNRFMVFVLVAGVLLLVAVLASAGPARRAVRADPTVALRAE